MSSVSIRCWKKRCPLRPDRTVSGPRAYAFRAKIACHQRANQDFRCVLSWSLTLCGAVVGKASVPGG